MKHIFFSALLVIFQISRYASADSLDWNTAEQIPEGTSEGVQAAVTIAPGPDEGNAIATWANSTSGDPYYSIYNNGTWVTGTISLGTSGRVSNNVYTAIGPNASEVMAAWSDHHETPYYSIYNGVSWTTDSIYPGRSYGANLDVVLAVGPNSGEITAVWADGSSYSPPYYSIYSGGTWTTDTIPEGTSNGAYQNVFISQGTTSGTLMATWSDRITREPYYSIYSSGVWEVAGTIPLGGSNGVHIDICVTQGPNSGEVVTAWADSNDYMPYYSIYQAGSWATGSVPLGTSSGVWGNVYITRGPSTGELVAVWKDLTSHVPYYSLYSSGSWSDGAPISLGASTGANNDVCVGLLLDGYTTIATWGDLTLLYLPYFATLVGQPPSPPPTPVNPPSNGKGKQAFNRFANYGEYFNKLQWTLSATSNVTNYKVYREGTLISTLPSSQSTYEDHNRRHVSITYSITAVDVDGNESSPLYIYIK